MDQMVDRISILPNDLLCHILSFLPTRQAFQTSVLSKRWALLCYSLSVLRFDFDYEIEGEAFDRFCRFVDTIMFSPLALNQPLKTLRLKCTSGTPITSLWLEAAKCRDVEEFHLIMNFHTLHPNIFISRTLVVLKLDMIEIAHDTSYVYLPSVKTLDLKFVYFKARIDYVNFLLGCPILQDLHAKHIYVCSEMNRDKNNVVAEKGLKSSVTLSKLVKASISSKDVLFNGIGNVEFLRIVTGFRSQEASFKFIPVFSNLIHLDLIFFHSSFHCWDGVVELLRHSPKLQILVIKKWTSTSSTEEWKHPIPILECVSSHLRSCTILDIQGSPNDLQFATYILLNARLLQDMKICICSNVMPSEKSLIVEELSSCPRRCKLSFEDKYCY